MGPPPERKSYDVVCFFNTDNLSERFCDFPEMPKVDYLAGGVEEGWWGGGGVVEWRGWAEGFGAKPVKSTESGSQEGPLAKTYYNMKT